MNTAYGNASENFDSVSLGKSSQDMFKALKNIQALDISKIEIKTLFEELLKTFLSISDSEYGFIGRVLIDDQKRQYLQTLAITNIAWNQETLKFYEDNIEAGLKFYNLDTLFGRVIVSGEPLISNDPRNDPRRGSLPEEHPPLNAFLGLPLFSGDTMIGMVGLANRPVGYDENLIRFLQPMLCSCSLLIVAQNNFRKRHEAEKILQLSEERLKLALEGSSDGLWDWSITTGDVYFSPRWMTMLGYEPFELEGSVKTWEAMVHPEDLPETREALTKHFEDNSPYQVQFRMRSKSGDWVWILARGKVVERDSGGKPFRMVGTHTDISEIKAVQEKLKRATDEAEKANRFKTEFLSQMSHELRTPLNAILGFGQIIQAATNLESDQAEDMKNIIHAGEHLLGLINQILDLSAIESGKMSITEESVSIFDTIDEVFKLLQPLAESMHVNLRQQDTLKDLCVRGDPLRLVQVLTNLISNAIKYNRAGGDVFVKWDQLPGDHCTITVADTGCGIPIDQQEKIFTSFYRCKEHSADIQGSGIGLGLSRELLRMMKGIVEVESKPGEGSQFIVTLPTVTGQSDPPKQITETREKPAVPQKPKHVLYIEDNMQNLRLVQQLFKKHTDYIVFHATTATTGLEMAANLKPDVIILDIRLPDKDGFDTFADLKANPETAGIPVIALSAEAMPDMVQRGMDMGFEAYVIKPFKVGEFLDIVQRHLGEVY